MFLIWRFSLFLTLLLLLFSSTPIAAQDDDLVAPSTTHTSERLVLSDTFDDSPSGFLDEESHLPDVVRYEYRNSRFVIEAKNDDFTGEVYAAPLGDFTDVTIAVDARLEGEDDVLANRYLLLACRSNPDQNTGYQLEIRPVTAQVTIWRQDGEVATPLASNIINGGVSIGEDYRRYELSCNGSSLVGSVDGAPVVAASDSNYGEGWISLGGGVYPEAPGRIKALYDNLAVSVPVALAGEVESSNVATAPVDRADLLGSLDDFRVILEETDPAFGPESGELRHAGDGFLQLVFTGVDLANFAMQVDFRAPDVDEAPSWDFGIAFRHASTADQWRLIIRSDATWHLAFASEPPRASGVLDSLDLSYGASNRIELFASGGVGYLVVNDQFAAKFDLAEHQQAGDLWIGSGIFPDFTYPGAVVPYEDLTIWALPETEIPVTVTAEPAPAPAATPTSEATEPAATPVKTPPPEATEPAVTPAVQATPAPAPTATGSPVPAGDVATELAAARTLVADQQPLQVAADGIIIQSEGQLDRRNAGVDVADAYLTVRFISPASPGAPDQPWDVVIGVRDDGTDEGSRLVIYSNGDWSFGAPGSEAAATGKIDNLVLGPNQFNDVELLMQGSNGYFAVNGQAAGAFSLPATPEHGDIWLSSGSTPATTRAGTATSFTGFRVWSLEE